jgi:hypothetical protein
MTITRGKDLVLIICNNSEVPTFTEDFQTADELGIYGNRSLRRPQGTESEASTPTCKDEWKKWQNNKFKKKKKKNLENSAMLVQPISQLLQLQLCHIFQRLEKKRFPICRSY